MSIPVPNPSPDFNITRTSHLVLSSNDLEKTRAFYEDVLGFHVSDQDDGALYVRGLEEAYHHSLVFIKSEGPRKCLRMGFRMYTDEGLKIAHTYFNERGHKAEFVERPYQGLTLHVNDVVGVPLEFCATMDQKPALLQQFHRHHGGKPMHLDHVQIATHNVQAAIDWYSELGFRMTEYTATDGTDELWGVWLKRKDTTQDVVFSNGRGPRLHHLAFHVSDIASIIHAADAASSMGFASSVERGPGRHGIANALFIYFRDPDGHRVELFTNHYLAIDSDFVAKRWELSDTSRSQLWGLPATQNWFFDATEFTGAPVLEPLLDAPPVTLEKFMEQTT